MEYHITIHVRRGTMTLNRLFKVKVDYELPRWGPSRARTEAELAQGIVSIRIPESAKDFVSELIQSLVGLPDIEKFTVTHELPGGTIRSRIRPMYGDRH